MVDQSVKHTIRDFESAICRRVKGPTLILLPLTLVLELLTANTSDFQLYYLKLSLSYSFISNDIWITIIICSTNIKDSDLFN